jgi:hypothetical protein
VEFVATKGAVAFALIIHEVDLRCETFGMPEQVGEKVGFRHLRGRSPEQNKTLIAALKRRATQNPDFFRNL